jgi:hypothetical protein
MGVSDSKEQKEEKIVISEGQNIFDFQYCYNTRKMYKEPDGSFNLPPGQRSKEHRKEPTTAFAYPSTSPEEKVDENFGQCNIVRTQILRALDQRLPEVYYFLEQVPIGANYCYRMIPDPWIFGFDKRQIYKRSTVEPPAKTRASSTISSGQYFYKSFTKLAQHLEIINLIDDDYVMLSDEQVFLLENILSKYFQLQRMLKRRLIKKYDELAKGSRTIQITGELDFIENSIKIFDDDKIVVRKNYSWRKVKF